MENKNFFISTFQERMEKLIESLKEKQKPLDLTKLLSGNMAERAQLIIDSIETEKQKKQSGYYITATLKEQLIHIAKEIELKENPIDISKVLASNVIDYVDFIKKSIEEEKDKEESGYYNIAPFSERVLFVIKQIEKQVEDDKIQKLEEVKLYIQTLENSKEYIKLNLQQTHITNIPKIDALLDKLSLILKKLEIKNQEINDLIK